MDKPSRWTCSCLWWKDSSDPAVLDSAGLVESKRTGREVRYSVRPEHLEVAVRAMAKVAARWDLRLEAIKRVAESRPRATR